MCSSDLTMLTMQFPLRDEQGTTYAVGSVSTDISHRKQLEESMRKVNVQLERKSTEIAAVKKVVL